MKNIILFIFFFISTYSFSQNKKSIYIDEDLNQIDSKEFYKKTKSKLFDTAMVSNDTAIFYKLRFKEYFGTLSKIKKKQLNIYLLKNNIDIKKVIVINYIDSIPNEKKMPKQSTAFVLDSLGDITKEYISLKKFLRKKKKFETYKRYVAVYNKPDYITQLEKKHTHYKNTQYINYYKTNKGFPESILKKNKYFKDNKQIIHNMFNDGLMVYSTIIIFSNGDFYTGKFDYGNTYHKKKRYDRAKKKWLKQFYL